MAVGTTGSPRNYPAARRDSYDQTGGRFATAAGYSDSGTHSLPYSFQNTYGDATVYQVSYMVMVMLVLIVMVQEVLPSQEEVVRRTEAITRCIQELLISAKDEQVGLRRKLENYKSHHIF